MVSKKTKIKYAQYILRKNKTMASICTAIKQEQYNIISVLKVPLRCSFQQEKEKWQLFRAKEWKMVSSGDLSMVLSHQ